MKFKAICENHPTVMRFSAGYGDFDIAYQSDFLRILKAYTIGVSLTESQQLVPTKTVTAIRVTEPFLSSTTVSMSQAATEL